jgi:hypothetical protein
MIRRFQHRYSPNVRSPVARGLISTTFCQPAIPVGKDGLCLDDAYLGPEPPPLARQALVGFCSHLASVAVVTDQSHDREQ